jgi:hypothetical protein
MALDLPNSSRTTSLAGLSSWYQETAADTKGHRSVKFGEFHPK